MDGFRGRVGVMAHMAQPPWHSHSGTATPVAPAHGMPPRAGPHHPIPLHIGVLGMGCRGQGCQCGTGTLPWPQLAAGSRPGTACRPAQQCCPAEHRASFPSQFWERGARRGNSSLGHMVLAGLSPAGGAAGGRLLCAEQGLPGSRAHQSPRPPPARRDHTGHGRARPPRGRRAACAAVMVQHGTPEPAAPSPPLRHAGLEGKHGHRRSSWAPTSDQDPQTRAASVLAGLGLHPDPLSRCHPQVTPEATQSLHPPMSA